MRITIELIQRSPQYVNPLGEREICFRGLKIPLIENLGATLVRPRQDQYEVIDLTNNELTRLEETAPLRHLTTFLLANNHISKISPDFGKELPYLENLVLTNNKVKSRQITELEEIDHLVNCRNLRRLSLLDNFVTKSRDYRAYVAHRLPQVLVLDFQKVKLKVNSTQERKRGLELFGSVEVSDTAEVWGKKPKLREEVNPAVPECVPVYLQTEGDKLQTAPL